MRCHYGCGIAMCIVIILQQRFFVQEWKSNGKNLSPKRCILETMHENT